MATKRPRALRTSDFSVEDDLSLLRAVKALQPLARSGAVNKRWQRVAQRVTGDMGGGGGVVTAEMCKERYATLLAITQDGSEDQWPVVKKRHISLMKSLAKTVQSKASGVAESVQALPAMDEAASPPGKVASRVYAMATPPSTATHHNGRHTTHLSPAATTLATATRPAHSELLSRLRASLLDRKARAAASKTTDRMNNTPDKQSLPATPKSQVAGAVPNEATDEQDDAAREAGTLNIKPDLLEHPSLASHEELQELKKTVASLVTTIQANQNEQKQLKAHVASLQPLRDVCEQLQEHVGSLAARLLKTQREKDQYVQELATLQAEIQQERAERQRVLVSTTQVAEDMAAVRASQHSQSEALEKYKTQQSTLNDTIIQRLQQLTDCQHNLSQMLSGQEKNNDNYRAKTETQFGEIQTALDTETRKSRELFVTATKKSQDKVLALAKAQTQLVVQQLGQALESDLGRRDELLLSIKKDCDDTKRQCHDQLAGFKRSIASLDAMVTEVSASCDKHDKEHTLRSVEQLAQTQLEICELRKTLETVRSEQARKLIDEIHQMRAEKSDAAEE